MPEHEEVLILPLSPEPEEDARSKGRIPEDLAPIRKESVITTTAAAVPLPDKRMKNGKTGRNKSGKTTEESENSKKHKTVSDAMNAL